MGRGLGYFRTRLAALLILLSYSGQAAALPTAEQLSGAIQAAAGFDMLEADVEVQTVLSGSQELKPVRFRLFRNGTDTTLRYENGLIMNIRPDQVTVETPDGKKRVQPMKNGLGSLSGLGQEDLFVQHDIIGIRALSQVIEGFPQAYEVDLCEKKGGCPTPSMVLTVAYPEGFIAETRILKTVDRNFSAITRNRKPMTSGAKIIARQMETTIETESGGMQSVIVSKVELSNISMKATK